VRILACGVLLALVAAPAAGTATSDSPAAAKRIVRAWSARLNAYDDTGAALDVVRARRSERT
jgi:hypothetical protein